MMLKASKKASTQQADTLIRDEYMKKLEMVPGSRIYLNNIFDATTPSLRFKYINDCVLREGVYKADEATQTGCQKCTPYMGQSIGCEYTRLCDCLEYAAVDESRLDEEMKLEFQRIEAEGGATMALPKKFPYFSPNSQLAGCLVPFYLNSRRPIYECNALCRCGPKCKNKNVQFGRSVELEIFKTGTSAGTDRGWGLRCRQDLSPGQFIDTYRGEIITDGEASRREQTKAKASYLYSLDKFGEEEGLSNDDIYVIDGELMGGPTKFINHSCEPNCRQYTVSYNKHDWRIYDIAFFAIREIPRGEELTFDYLDKEEDDDDDDGDGPGKEGRVEGRDEPGEGAVPCLCGTKKCRKWLWQ